MDAPPRRGIGAIVLGLCLSAASLLWTLFWLLGLAWVWPPEFANALFLGVCFALAIVAGLVGMFLVGRGTFPSRRTWLSVGAVALAPVVVLASVGLITSHHSGDVDRVAEQALAERTGVSDITAACIWEYDESGSELWRCDMSTTTESDVCLVWVTKRRQELVADVDSCEGERAIVARFVRDRYQKLRGVSTTVENCWRQTSGARRGELWRCDLPLALDDSYCYSHVSWGKKGHVGIEISHCEREASTAAARAYAKRSGRYTDRAQCTEDHQDKGEWLCDIGAGASHDRCVLAFEVRARSGVRARISYCQQEVGAAVERSVERFYEKRTRSDDVTAACTLEEHERWGCDIRLRAGRDHCDVAIALRSERPKVDFAFTSCLSGRI